MCAHALRPSGWTRLIQAASNQQRLFRSSDNGCKILRHLETFCVSFLILAIQIENPCTLLWFPPCCIASVQFSADLGQCEQRGSAYFLSNLMCTLWSRWDLFLFILLITLLFLLTDAFCGILISPLAEHYVVPEEWWLQGQGSSQLLLIYQSNSITDISVFYYRTTYSWQQSTTFVIKETMIPWLLWTFAGK